MDGLTQQSGFGAGTGGDNSPSTAATDAVTPSAETSTNDSPSSDGGGGSTPPAAATKGADNTVAESEKGSFKLVYNPRTNRNEVVSTMPTENEAEDNQTQANVQQSQAETKQAESKPQAQDSYAGDELLKYMQAVQQLNQQQQLQQQQPTYYPQPQPQVQPQPQAQQQQPAEVDEVAQAKEYYTNVNRMAQERAMQEIGITQDELDVAEYSDDQELLDKVSAYKTAIENNRSRIMQDVENIRRTWESEKQDHSNAYQAVIAFAEEMRKKEPNFDAIDRMMITRIAKMPYEKAVTLEPLIRKVQNGTLTTADLPALQEMYNQTRLEFYSKREGVGLAPQVQKPSFVETPGSGGDVPRQQAPLSALGKMSKRDREAAIGQMFGNFFDD